MSEEPNFNEVLDQPNRDQPNKIWTAYGNGARQYKKLLRVPGLNVTHSGINNIPSGGAVLSVGKHNSYTDALDVAYPLFHELGRPVRFVAGEDVYKNQRLAKMMINGDSIPIDRSAGADRYKIVDQLSEAIRVVANGGLVAIAPEGQISHDEELAELMGGVGWIATKGGVDIVPVGLAAREWHLAGRRLPGSALIPRSVHVHYDKPLSTRDLTKKQVDKMLREVQLDAIAKAEKEYLGIYGHLPRTRLHRRHHRSKRPSTGSSVSPST